MKAQYEVQFDHFIIVDGVAKANAATTKLRDVDSLELLQILMIFQNISPIQHFEGEPTITILTRKNSRHLVRTDLNKLILSDPRDVLAPSRVLEATSILLEIEDQTGARRRVIQNHLTGTLQHKQEHESREDQTGRKTHGRASRARTSAAGNSEGRTSSQQLDDLRRITKTELLAIAALTLSALFLGAHWWANREAPSPSPAPIPVKTAEDRLRLGHGLIGTYMTGKAPGDHAIIIWDAERITFLELGNTPPAELKATYTLGQGNGGLFLCVPGYDPILASPAGLRMGTLLFTRQ